MKRRRGLELLVVAFLATATHLSNTVLSKINPSSSAQPLPHQHTLNASLHAVTAAAFYLLLLHLSSRSPAPSSSSSSSSVLFPFFAAAAFAIHPIHTESVVAADHAGALAGFLFVCSMLVYSCGSSSSSSSSSPLRGQGGISPHASSWPLAFLLRLLSLVLGLACVIITRETGGLALPLVLVAFEACACRDVVLRRLVSLLLLFLLPLLLLALFVVLGFPLPPSLDWIKDATTSFRPAPLQHWLEDGLTWLYHTACSVLLLLFPAPRPLGFSLEHERISSLADARNLLAAGLLPVLGLAWLFAWRRMSAGVRASGSSAAPPGWGLLLLGLSWLVAGLLSTSNLPAAIGTKAPAMAERGLYIPSLGFSMLVGLLLAYLHVSRPRLCVFLALLLCASCSVSTLARLNTLTPADMPLCSSSSHHLDDLGHSIDGRHHPQAPPLLVGENEPPEDEMVRTLMLLAENKESGRYGNEETKSQALVHSVRTLLKHPNLPRVHALAREVIVRYLPELAIHWQGRELVGTPNLARVVMGVGEHLFIADLVSTAMAIDPSVSGPFYVRQFRRAVELAAQGRPAAPESWGAPRGIVISAGGLRYLTAAYINLHILRETGCQLPVELWYNGPEEMPLQAKNLFSGISNLRLMDVSQFISSSEKQQEASAGYRIKAFAIAHSSFREVMLLDADNAPIRDPAFLFKEPSYAQSGAIFWPDNCGVQSISQELWTLLDLQPPAAEAEFPGPPYAKKSGCKDKRYDNEFETGQLIIDKGRHWSAVQGVLYMNTNYHYFYQHMHGDKETFRLAFKAARSPFHLVEYPPTIYGQLLPKKRDDAPPRMCGSGVWGQRHPVSGEVLFVHNYKWFPTQLVDAEFNTPLLQVAADEYTSLIWRKGCGPLAFAPFYAPKSPVVRALVGREALVEQRGRQLMRQLWDSPVYQDIFCQELPSECQMILQR